jgi:hypothetical protein
MGIKALGTSCCAGKSTTLIDDVEEWQAAHDPVNLDGGRIR